MDSAAEFDEKDILIVRHSLCGTKVKMGDPYDASEFTLAHVVSKSEDYFLARRRDNKNIILCLAPSLKWVDQVWIYSTSSSPFSHILRSE